MSIDRKEFLALMAAGAAGAALLPHELLAADTSIVERLRSAIGQAFLVRREDGRTASLVLARFEDRPSARGTVQFSLFFDAPEGERLAQGTYPMTGRGTGEMPVFLVPVTRMGKATAYRADFNLLR